MLKKIFTVSLLLSLSTSCQFTTPPQTIGNNVLLVQEDEQTITVEFGETFAIKLDSDATKKYKWEVARIFDESILKAEKSEFVGAGGPIPGTGDFELWYFKGLKKGETTVKMIFIPSTGDDITPQKEHDYKVIVN